MKSVRQLLVSAALLGLPAALAAQEALPANGTMVLERMRSAYEGKWYHTLTFAQKTTTYGKDGQKRIQSGTPSPRPSRSSRPRTSI